MIRNTIDSSLYTSDATYIMYRNGLESDYTSIPNTALTTIDYGMSRDVATNGWDMVLPYLGLTVNNQRDIYIIAGRASQGTVSQINSKLQIGYSQSVPDLTKTEYLSVNGDAVFVSDVTATAFYESSLRELKENIEPFDKSGLDLINKIDIVTYDKKDKTIKDKIGIIIDESPKEFANPEKNKVDLYKTIFIQAKAIQELSDKLNMLENKINNGSDR